MRQVAKNNNDMSTSYWSHLNQFAAMSAAEFSDAMLTPLRSFKFPGATNASRPSGPMATAAPASKDWRADGKIPPVRDQGNVSASGGRCGCHRSRRLHH